jgi:diphthine-ammonia ligase
MGVPLYRREILGRPIHQGSEYTETVDDETEDLYMLLKDVLVSTNMTKTKKST